MKYKIVQAANLDKFVERVNEAIKEGWSLAGGVAAAGGGEWEMFYQAMTKTE